MTVPSPLASLPSRGVQLTVGPFTVRIRSPLRGVHDHLHRFYADFPMAAGDEGQFDIAVVPGVGRHRWFRRQARIVINGVAPFLPLPEALAGPSIEWALNRCIGRTAHRWIAVHAAVVERGGQVLILAAASGSGKSTLCAALVASGWRLFSDEFALIDPESIRIYPAPRPISLKNAAIEIIRRRQRDVVFGPAAHDVDGALFVHMRPPRDSVLRANEGALPGLVIFPRFVGGSPTRFEPLQKGRALLQLTDHSFNYNFLGARGYAGLAALVRRTDCYHLQYGDLDAVVHLLDGIVPRLTIDAGD